MDLGFKNLNAISIVEDDPLELTDRAWKCSSSSLLQVRFLRGRKATSVTSFFDEFAASLQFPYYFGENWDAFEDCITDLSWLDTEKLLIIIFDADYLLADATTHVSKNLIKILSNATSERELAFANVPDIKTLEIKTLLHCTKGKRSSIEARFFNN